MTDEQHTSDLFSLEEGDKATLELSDGPEMKVAVRERSTHHDDSGPHITEQTTLTLERLADGAELQVSKTDGLSGLPDADPFPSHIPLFDTEGKERGRKIPDEYQYGYVTNVQP